MYCTAVEFEEWKHQHERETNSSYIKTTGEKGEVDVTKMYYYCNRSGYFNPRGQQKRHLKSQGSSKLNAYCTAGMVLTQTQHGIQVDICSTHYGHSIRLGHLRLPVRDRQTIAAKLHQSVPFECILDDIRENTGNSLSRLHLTTRKDIANIERAFGLRRAERHKDDATSVAVWVQDMMKSESNPVLLYKPQGSQPSQETPSLEENDFILALQTPLQADMLVKFGSNIICMDDTHGTNSYDFSLITLLVVDEFGEGCPVAWCLCNKTDKYILIDFLMAVRKRVGMCTIKPKWVMTDDAEQYFAAWIAVFGQGPRKLLCTWHVDRAWRGAVNNIKDKEVAVTVYHNVRVLMEETDVGRFKVMLQKTLRQLNECDTTQDFAKYFDTYYARRAEQWAACYRKSASINTNMYVESSHRILKYTYMRGRTNRRIDNLLHVLLKVSGDKGFERLCKLEKGKFLDV